MTKRAVVLLVGTLSSGLAIAASSVLAQKDGGAKVALTIYGANSSYAYNPAAGYGAYAPYGAYGGAYGGYAYGGYSPYGVGYDASLGFAVVKERRAIELDKGLNEVRFEGVAAQVDAGTVRFKSATDAAGTAVVEQKFRYDLASPETLLAKYVDHDVTVVTESGEVTGTLLSYDAQQLVVRTDDATHPIHIVRRGDNVRDIRFGPLPDGLVTRPTLMWRVKAAKAGTHEAEISYRTGGLSWSADYTVVWDQSNSKADLSAWVTIANNSGVDFRDASVKLVSGGGQPAYNPYGYAGGMPAYTTGYGDTGGGGVLGFDVFDLGQRVSLEHRGSKQVELLAPIVGAKANKVLVHDSIPNYTYYPLGYPNMDMYAFNYQARRKDADVYLELATDKKTSTPMPQGKARLYARKRSGELELITEAQVPHTSGEAPMRLRVGAQAKLEVEHKQVEFRLDEPNKQMRETVEVQIENTDKTAVDVVVREVVGWRWTDWSIESESIKGSKSGPLVQEYRIKVPAGKKKTLKYTALYTW